MSKFTGFTLTDEARAIVEKTMAEASEGFEGGRLGISDIVSELIVCSKIDIRALQIKHMDLRKSLRALAARADVDVEMVMKMLADLKGKGLKKRSSGTNEEVN